MLSTCDCFDTTNYSEASWGDYIFMVDGDIVANWNISCIFYNSSDAMDYLVCVSKFTLNFIAYS